MVWIYYSLHNHSSKDAHFSCFSFLFVCFALVLPTINNAEKHSFMFIFIDYCLYFCRRGSHSGIIASEAMWIIFFLVDIARLFPQGMYEVSMSPMFLPQWILVFVLNFCNLKTEQYIILNFPISEVKCYFILPTRHNVVIVSISFNTVFFCWGLYMF